ncbi:MAG: CAP domain-containing protein [Parcubacteria group bacterium]|jgi:hypothetical protein
MHYSEKCAIQQGRVDSIAKGEYFSSIFDFFGVEFLLSLALLFGVMFSFASAEVKVSDISSSRVIDLTNATRAENGEKALLENARLSKAAEDKAKDMIGHDYFSHNSPEGLTPWHWIDKEQYDYDYAGENLAMDFSSSEKMHQAWLDSPTHRANILNEKYKEIGVAVEKGKINGHDTILVVVLFGSGDKKNPLPPAAQPKEKKAQKDKIKIEYPLLPEDGTISANNSFSPIITNPQDGAYVSGDVMAIFGRALPKEKIEVQDNGKSFASTMADEKGWFETELVQPKEGEHRLQAKSYSQIDAVGNRARLSLNEIKVTVDRTKPEVNYHIFGEENGAEELLAEVKSSEPGCTYELGGATVYTLQDQAALLKIPRREALSAIKVSDRAGNTATKQINLAGLYIPSKQGGLTDKIAEMLGINRALASTTNSNHWPWYH